MSQDKRAQSRHGSCDHATWTVAVLLVALLSILTYVPPATAFKVIDQAMCKYVDPITHECKERTNQFDLTDEWAFFWFRGTMETSDAGAREAQFSLYGPDGQQFLGGPFVIPFVSPVAAPKPGEDVVGWIGIGILKTKISVGLMPGISIAADEPTINGRPVRSASEKPGEWWAEFTLDGRVVVSERFRIGKMTTATPTTVTTPIVTGTETQPSVAALPYDLVLIASVIAVVMAVGVTLLVRRRRAATNIPPATSAGGSHE